MAADASSEFAQYRKPTRRDEFLKTMDTLVPWSALCAEIAPHYPKAGNGRPPIGLDIKAPLHRYHSVTATVGSGVPAQESLRLVLDSGVDYECRTTWHSGLFEMADLLALAEELAALGVTRWVLQQCHQPNGVAFAITSDQIALFSRLFKHFSLRTHT